MTITSSVTHCSHSLTQSISIQQLLFLSLSLALQSRKLLSTIRLHYQLPPPFLETPSQLPYTLKAIFDSLSLSLFTQVANMATTRAREPTATTKQLAAVGGGGRQGKEDIKKKEMGKPSDQLLRRPLASVPPHQATGGQQPQPKKKETKPTDKESSLNPLAPPLPSAPTIISAIKEEVLEKALTIPIDPQEAEDVFQCPEYVHDIYRHMVESEQKPCYAVSGHSFVDRFSSITTEHRSILVDWLIQVHLKFKLLQETLYIAVDILDRYLDVS